MLLCTGGRSIGEGSGEQTGGRVTRAQWHEHHADVSALFSSDEAFCGYLRHVWQAAPLAVEVTCGGVGSNVGDKGACRVGDYIARCGSTQGARGLLKHGIGMCASGETSLRPEMRHKEISRPQTSLPRRRRPPLEAWQPSPFNAEQGRSVPHTTSDTQGDDGEAIEPTSLDIDHLIRRVRSSLAARGALAALQLLRGFLVTAGKGAGKVTLPELKTIIGDAELDLGEADAKSMFQVRHDTHAQKLPRWKTPQDPMSLLLVSLRSR